MSKNLFTDQLAGLSNENLFPSNSRYSSIAKTTITMQNGENIAYMRRRFIPDPEILEQIGEVEVTGNERLDLLAARTFGQAELHWRIADANRAFDPADLIAEPGKKLKIAGEAPKNAGDGNA